MNQKNIMLIKKGIKIDRNEYYSFYEWLNILIYK